MSLSLVKTRSIVLLQVEHLEWHGLDRAFFIILLGSLSDLDDVLWILGKLLYLLLVPRVVLERDEKRSLGFGL